MKKLYYILIIVLFAMPAHSQLKKIENFEYFKWVGKYTFEEKISDKEIFYEMELFEDGYGTFEGKGYHTKFGINIDWGIDGHVAKINYENTYKGYYSDKRGDGPLATMSIKDGQYYLNWSGGNSRSGVYKLKKEN